MRLPWGHTVMPELCFDALLVLGKSSSTGWICPAIGLGFVVILVLANRKQAPSRSESRQAPKPQVSKSLPAPLPKKLADAVNAAPSDIEMNEGFKQALELIHKRRESAFITGRAGTGKSTLLRHFRMLRDGTIAVLAPTGLAAINVGGQTIHSFFKFKPRLIDVREIRPMRDRGIFLKLETLIIDEVSMVRGDLLDGVDHALRVNRGDNRPFGGLQVVMFGDPLQLPPIVKEHELRRYFAENYGSPFFFDAHVFRNGAFRYVELQTVYRQREQLFLDALSDIRDGTNIPAALQVLNSRVVPTELGQIDSNEIVLTTTNARANQINQHCLEAIREESVIFRARVTGQFEESSYPTDRDLPLKVGAKVMMIRNDASRRWVNGTLGIVQELRPRSALIRVGSASFEVQPERWENVKYEYDEEKQKVVPCVVGVFEQVPLRIAYAITIHKSQGQTFDRVRIDLDRGAFAHGQLYVAVSRCRTLEGMRLARPITIADVIVDPQAKQFRTKFLAFTAGENSAAKVNAPQLIGGSANQGRSASAARDWKAIMQEAENAKKRMLVDVPDGEMMFGRLLAQFSDDGMVYFKRGQAYESLGRNRAAASDYENACRLLKMPVWKGYAESGLARVKQSSANDGEQPTS